MANETNNNLTAEQMAARIAELEGRLAKGSSLSFKVSEKGAVSVYGLGRFPVTLYLEQWDAFSEPARRAQCAGAGTASSKQGQEDAVHGAPAPHL